VRSQAVRPPAHPKCTARSEKTKQSC
jgi:hypothetical protein